VALVRWPRLARCRRGAPRDQRQHRRRRWTPAGALVRFADPTGFRNCTAGATRGRAARSRSRASRSAPAHRLRSLTAPAVRQRSGRAAGVAPGAGARGKGRSRLRSRCRFDSAPPVPVSETGTHVAVAASPFLDFPVFENAGPTGRFGGALTADRRPGSLRLRRGPVHFPAPVPRRRATSSWSPLCWGNPTLPFGVGRRGRTLDRHRVHANLTVSELDHYAALGRRS